MRVCGADQALRAVRPSTQIVAIMQRPQRTFLVMMNDVPIAADDEMASASPMYLSFGLNEVTAPSAADTVACNVASILLCAGLRVGRETEDRKSRGACRGVERWPGKRARAVRVRDYSESSSIVKASPAEQRVAKQCDEQPLKDASYGWSRRDFDSSRTGTGLLDTVR